MIDFVLGLALAAMLVRGWTRGFVRESLDLIGLILGAWIAFRLSGPFGDFLSERFSVPPEVARIGGGILLFVLFGVLLSIGAHYLSRVMNLPGLSMVNRVGGAAIAVGWGVVILLVVVSLLSVLPLPDSWRNNLEQSKVVSLIAGEDALPRRAFEAMAGDDVMGAMAAIRGIFGSARAVPEGGETLMFPAAEADEIRQVRAEAAWALEKVNEHRLGAGVGALATVGEITELAEDHAAAAYRAGLLRRMGDCAAQLAQRDYTVLTCDNRLALAATTAGGLDGILESPEGLAMIETSGYDRAGAAVVDGPTGRLLVLILSG
jgi:uncharacterized membrane protein required for colicin V production